jgi:hypothetical protein
MEAWAILANRLFAIVQHDRAHKLFEKLVLGDKYLSVVMEFRLESLI